VVTGGSSYENLQNLPEFYIEQVIRRFQGTRLGQQEIYAQLLGDTPGALWTRDLLERTRVKEMPTLSRIVVAVDPAASSTEGAAETGIIVAGAVPAQRGRPPECYVLDDLSMRGTPAEWTRAVCAAYRTFRCDRIVAEANQGGEMVSATIHAVDPKVPVLLVRATRGKYTRAEPVAALYEQNLVHHVGMFPELEDQLATFVPGEASPDRLLRDAADALVWAITSLVEGKGAPSRMPDPGDLARPNAWAIGNEGLAGAPHLYTDY
jgi:phage terminase large subunit-like protein